MAKKVSFIELFIKKLSLTFNWCGGEKIKNKNKIFMFLLFPLLFAGFFEVEYSCLASESGIVINEVMYNPAEGDNKEGEESTYEWIELKNMSVNQQSISSWSIRAKTYYSLDVLKTPVPSKGYVIIYEGMGINKNEDFSEGNNAYLYMNKTGSQLGNSNGDVALYNNSSKNESTIVDYIAYGESSLTTNYTHSILAGIWQEGTFISKSLEGYSIELEKDGEDNNSVDDWQESYILGGTPGYENFTGEDKKPEPKTYSKEIRINELLPNPKESPESKYEYVELYNPSGESIDLSGWTLKDKTKDKTGEYKLSGNIEAGLYLVFYDTVSLNNGGDEITLYNPNGEIVSQVLYNDSKENVSYNFNGGNWRWSKYLTPGAENEFNESTGIKIKAERKIYKNTYADFKAQVKNPDNDKLKFTWDFGDSHKSYKKNTRHKYDKTGKFKVTLKVFDGSEETTEEFKVEVKKFPKNKIKIIELSPNPEGKDSDNEYIIVKNESKKKINLKNWAIATGSKKLYNHPISKDLIVKPGEEVKIGRDASKFALNNKKAKIELRYPDGKVAYKTKYDKKEESAREGEIYEKTEMGWAWKRNNQDTLLAVAGKNTSAAIAMAGNNEEMTEKNSEDQATGLEEKEKLALSSETASISLENEKVLGASVEVKENNPTDIVNKAESHPEKNNITIELFRNMGSNINSFINRIIFKFF